jgi:hypothetical protein
MRSKAIGDGRASLNDTEMAQLYEHNRGLASKLDGALKAVWAERFQEEEIEEEKAEKREENRKAVDEAFVTDLRAAEWMRRIEEMTLQARRASRTES